MLQIRDVCKEYRTGTLVQKALDHVSLNLRDNEFVAILGPSGSGKTTLLNIIGGLDRYDSGDLIINGISTRRYKDRDWDSYRNHTIGFVFQSYNLIPHQTVLANVELALTISGISGNERRQRAEEALIKVGLGEQMHKKPAQMSGGQMQRVAIARALVNDPDILLADEPTGALDSDTSVTIMDLLKEVAEDRLVVMVTHNPELAEQYATRIVNLKDGHIIGDSDPVEIEHEEEAVHKNMGKSSMSFLTALSLSFNNLRSKLTRTILVSFAGSIGIIGIALIMSLSNGVNKYIQTTEEETLLEYPLEIQSNALSLSSLIESSDKEHDKEEAEVTERRIASTMFSRIASNDLGSLKKYFDSEESHIMDYARAVEYSYNVTPLIYRMENEEARQVNPDTSFSALGFSTSSFMFSSAMNTDVFRALPADENLYKESYELKAGRWADNYNELMLVVSSSGKLTDTVLYTLGLKDADELTRMMEAFSAGKTVKEEEGPLLQFDYEDFTGITFKLVNSYEKYVYDGEYDVWTDKSDDQAFINKLARNGEDLVITGVLQVKEDASVATLMQGIYYQSSLISHIIKESSQSQITYSQLANPQKNVFSGKEFNAPKDEDDGLNLETLFSVDPDALSNVFSFDSSKLTIDTSSLTNIDMSDMNLEGVDSSALSSAMPSVSSSSITDMLSNVNIEVNTQGIITTFQKLLNGYSNDKTSQEKLKELDESFTVFLKQETTQEWMAEEIKKIIVKQASETITEPVMTTFIKHVMSGFPEYAQAHWPSAEEDEGSGSVKTVVQELLDSYIASDDAQTKIAEGIKDIIIFEFESKAIPSEDISNLVTQLIGRYEIYAAMQTALGNPTPSTSVISETFNAYLNSTEGRAILSEGISSSVNTSEIEKQLNSEIQSMTDDMTTAITKAVSDMMVSYTAQITKKIAEAMENAVKQMAGNMNQAFSIHPDAFANAISMNMDEQELSELLTSLMSKESATYDSNLKLLGYADEKKPYSITIYPIDFESKAEIINILDSYNEQMKKEDEDKVITYTDTVGLLMTSVTDIINAISYVLIAFVAISLVVSSIMIGVITYISVLERRKEIGILRAIGASKRNISSVFNAETFIIGLLAGIFGIGITLILLVPGNQLIRHFTDADVRAQLPVASALGLILLSVILTMIGGILPSQKAAKSDPVAALRSE